MRTMNRLKSPGAHMVKNTGNIQPRLPGHCRFAFFFFRLFPVLFFEILYHSHLRFEAINPQIISHELVLPRHE